MGIAEIIKAYVILKYHGLDMSSLLDDGFVSINAERKREIFATSKMEALSQLGRLLVLTRKKVPIALNNT